MSYTRRLIFFVSLTTGSAANGGKHPLIRLLNHTVNKELNILEDTWRIPRYHYRYEPLEVVCEKIQKYEPDTASHILFAIAEHAGRLKECVFVPTIVTVGGSPFLRNGSIDIDYLPVSRELNLNSVIDFLYPHDIENLCLVAPKAPRESSSVLSTVPLAMWMVILAFFLLCYIAVLTIHSEGAGYALVEVFRTLVTGGFGDRLSCLVWMSILSFFLSNTIGGSLTGSIVTPGYNKEINTLQEVLDSVETIYSDGYDINGIHALKEGEGVTAAIAKKQNWPT